VKKRQPTFRDGAMSPTVYLLSSLAALATLAAATLTQSGIYFDNGENEKGPFNTLLHT
jgi:hypothetical protein